MEAEFILRIIVECVDFLRHCSIDYLFEHPFIAAAIALIAFAIIIVLFCP
jgi:hypothetical protein